MHKNYAGGCACGALRYECGREPLAMYNCHCRVCQRTGGGPYASLLVVPATAVKICGNPTYCAVKASNTNHTKHGFCSACGTSLFVANPEQPEILLVKAATLDEPDWFVPIADIWAISALPWAQLDYRIPKVLKSPPLLEKDAVVRF